MMISALNARGGAIGSLMLGLLRTLSRMATRFAFFIKGMAWLAHSPKSSAVSTIQGKSLILIAMWQ